MYLVHEGRCGRQGCVYILDSQTVVLKDPQSILGRLSEKSSGQMAQTFSFSKVGTEENIGILPRTLNVLFDSLQERLCTKMNLKPHRSREYLRLSPDQEKEEVASKSALLRQIKEVVVHNDSSDTLYDLQWVQVSDSKEAYRLLKLGIKHQSVAFTKLNNASSRRLSLCDLAGSERSMKTQNEGERLRETGNINTSLLTLGKCINVLKNSEKSKFQQHVPFRESKLTHYFQSFFNGKGKICMIVNISQCFLAYDETLNVLKFSAIAQKVCVPDTLNSSQEKSFGPVKSSQDVSLDINSSDNKILNEKRSTISWESSLEDVVEDEDLVEDLEKAEEKQNVESEFTDEDLDKTLEDDKAFSSHEEKREREILEENAECRLAIFKDLVGKCDTQEEPSNEDRAMKAETEEGQNYVGIEDIIGSLQDDVTDIKKQAEIAHLCIASLADPQEAIACLELKFNQVKAELAKTKEELIKTQEELKKRENESEINLNSLVQELEKSIKDNAGISPLIINNKLVCNEMIEMSKDSKTKTYSGRKRLNEIELQQDEPPAKKGTLQLLAGDF
ncbi:hypothetical protein J1605_021819 [Eschrichtius robustus]|uniref:Kinesin motor domain-containing protein n=1 Tax=Eschrichtius robustus TaxID=9764 RepID=A0AB34HDR4_ESCRO|nr:hypothetical protein J1605_021819 [Eschrichtius robustus]